MPRPRTKYDISDLQTVRQVSRNINFPLRTIYGLIKRELIKPVMFAGKMTLDTQAVEKLKAFRANLTKHNG